MKRSTIAGICAALFSFILLLVGKIELGERWQYWWEMLELGFLAAGFLSYFGAIMLRKEDRKSSGNLLIAGLVLTGFAGLITMITFLVITGLNYLIINDKVIEEFDDEGEMKEEEKEE